MNNLPDKIRALSDGQQMVLRNLHRRLNASYRHVSVNFKFVGMVNGALDTQLSRDGRMAFFRWAFASNADGTPRNLSRSIESSHDLTVPEMYALVLWAGPRKDESDGKWKFSNEFAITTPILAMLFSGGLGQPELPGTQAATSSPADRKQRNKKILRELGYEDQ